MPVTLGRGACPWLAFSILVLSAVLFGCGADQGSPDGNSVIVLGFDGMDPELTQQLIDAGRLPNLARLAEAGTFTPLETSIPPQSPVAWSNFITGMDAGGHGIFDFLHRNPETLIPVPSTTEVSEGKVRKLGPYQLRSDSFVSLRRGTPFWEVLEEHDVETTIVRMPANFPPSGSASRELSGMGTQDLLGTDGTFSFYTSELFAFAGQDIDGGEIYEVDIYDDVVTAELHGPDNPFLAEPTPLTAPFVIYLDPQRTGVKVELDDQEVVLEVGDWSDWLEVEFEMVPTQTLRGICRMYLKQLEPELELYVSPIDVDPLQQAMPVSHPESFAAELADLTGSRFYTEGMPEDTKAITEGVFGVEDFLAQAQIAGGEPIEQYPALLESFLARRGGLLFYYFGNVDQVGHVMWRSRDPDHPGYDAADDAPYEDLIPELYEDLDRVVGQTLDAVDGDTLVVVMSDHGFTSWRRSFHLNRWLADQGYLVLKDPNAQRDPGFLLNVDWSKTRAYGYGFSGLYVNLKGREREGIVPFAEKDALLREIGDGLLQALDPKDGQRAITEIHYAEDYEHRGALDVGPDMIVGYAKGYHVDNGSALGELGGAVFTDNENRWSGDHIMDHRTVPGVLFTNRPLKAPAPRLQDLAGVLLLEFAVSGFPS